MSTATQIRLPRDVSQILYVKSLPFKISNNELYNIFGQFGPIKQIRLGNNNETRGRAFVVYDNIIDAYHAQQHLNGYQVQGRYLVVLYYQNDKYNNNDKKQQLKEKQQQDLVNELSKDNKQTIRKTRLAI